MNNISTLKCYIFTLICSFFVDCTQIKGKKVFAFTKQLDKSLSLTTGDQDSDFKKDSTNAKVFPTGSLDTIYKPPAELLEVEKNNTSNAIKDERLHNTNFQLEEPHATHDMLISGSSMTEVDKHLQQGICFSHVNNETGFLLYSYK